MEPLDGGRGRTRDALSQIVSWGISITLPEKNCVEELFYGFPGNTFPRNAKKAQKNDGDKASNPLVTHYFCGEYWKTKIHLISHLNN